MAEDGSWNRFHGSPSIPVVGVLYSFCSGLLSLRFFWRGLDGADGVCGLKTVHERSTKTPWIDGGSVSWSQLPTDGRTHGHTRGSITTEGPIEKCGYKFVAPSMSDRTPVFPTHLSFFSLYIYPRLGLFIFVPDRYPLLSLKLIFTHLWLSAPPEIWVSFLPHAAPSDGSFKPAHWGLAII